MGLRNDIEQLANLLPSSHVPGGAEHGKLLNAILAYLEHGPAVIQAAIQGSEHVAHLLGTSVESEWQRIRFAAENPGAPTPPAPSAPVDSSPTSVPATSAIPTTPPSFTPPTGA